MSKNMQKKDILDFFIPPEVAFGALIVMIVFPFQPNRPPLSRIPSLALHNFWLWMHDLLFSCFTIS